MYCEKCGEILGKNVIFCENCGNKVDNQAEENKQTNFSQQRGPIPPHTKENNTHTSVGNRQQVNMPPPYTPSNTHMAYGTDEISLGQYILMFFLSSIPIVNLVFLIKWAFIDKGGNPNKRNFAKAMLIFMVIFLLIYVVWMLIVVTTLTSYY